MVTSDFRPEMEKWSFCACTVKNTRQKPYLWRNHQNSVSYRKSGSRNTMATSCFRLELEIWLFCACAVKICNISLVIETIWSLCSCYEADITFHRMCFQLDKKPSESALESLNFRYLQENRGRGIKRQCEIFLREPPKQTLMRMRCENVARSHHKCC